MEPIGRELSALAKELERLQGEQAKAVLTVAGFAKALKNLNDLLNKVGGGIDSLRQHFEWLVEAYVEGDPDDWLKQYGLAKDGDAEPAKAKPQTLDPSMRSYWVDDTEAPAHQAYCPRHNVMKIKRDIEPGMEGLNCIDDNCGSMINERGHWELPPLST